MKVDVSGTGVGCVIVDAGTMVVEYDVVLTTACRIMLVCVNDITGNAYSGAP